MKNTKRLFLVSSIALIILICPGRITSQTTQTILNQTDLMKQFTGSWKLEINKGSIFYWEAKPYGTGFETNLKIVSNGITKYEGKQLLGYDKKRDKYIVAQMFLGQDIEIGTVWFQSETKYKWIPNCDISDPESANMINEGEFKSPDMFVETRKVNNNPVQTLTYVRVK